MLSGKLYNVMKYLALDIGTYSIKSFLMNMERKTFSILEATEYILSDYAEKKENGTALNPEEIAALQQNIITEIYPDNFEGKIIWQIPNSYVASRNLELPITQRKKVEMMIPFQLDETLPFPASEAHFFSQLEKNGTSTKVLANITKKSRFLDYYNTYKKRGILPMYLTSELSCIHAHAQNRKIKGPVAILDMGHSTSKCYIIYQGEVVEHHVSYCAGASIDEMIAQTYSIHLKEASHYKHENCFFLTDSQYDEVSEDQKSFALLMKKTMTPLTLELKRWLLGFRIKYGVQIDTIFLTGGTSNIHNIGNFLSQAVNVKTNDLDIAQSFVDQGDLIEGREANFFISMLMNIGLSSKFKPGNFLYGEYSNGSGVTLPLHSASMLFYRSLAITLILGLLMGVEHYILSSQEKKLDRTISTLIKNKSLHINTALGRNISRNLKRLQSIVKTTHRTMKQEVSTLSSATQANALPPLFKIFQVVSAAPKITLQKFQTDGIMASGVFQITSTELLKNVDNSLKNSGLANIKTKINADKIEFSFNN